MGTYCIDTAYLMIHIQDVSKSFKGTPAVQNLSLQVGEGEILGLLGANGAGKSTTIHLLLGFLKPDTGTVTVGQIDASQKAQEARRFIGYIPENVSLYPYLSGLENLDYFCRLAGLKYPKNELHDILDVCGLQAESHHRKVSGYSKGMRQKVGIAISFAKKAKVYLLDEPASGLDPVASYELSGMLKKLSAGGATVLMASHDIFRVREICHRIGILKKGTLVNTLKSEEVTAYELEKLYLEFMKN